MEVDHGTDGAFNVEVSKLGTDPWHDLKMALSIPRIGSEWRSLMAPSL